MRAKQTNEETRIKSVPFFLALGYEDSPLERMAYELQREFEAGRSIPQLELQVREKTMLVAKAFNWQMTA